MDEVIKIASELQDSRNEEKFVGVTPPKPQVVFKKEQNFCKEAYESNVCNSDSVYDKVPVAQVNSDDTIFHSDHVRSAGGDSIKGPLQFANDTNCVLSSDDESVVSIYTEGTKLNNPATKKRQERVIQSH